MIYKKWRKFEIEFIKNNARNLSDKEIALGLGRTWKSVNSKRKELGIKSKFSRKYIGEKNGNWKGGKIITKCFICKKEIEKARWEIERSKFCVCSKKCLSKYLKSVKGEDHQNFKGKWQSSDGYIMVHKPKHENADKFGYMREHRLIMEKKIGRILKKSEVVHHINENRSDNSIYNLMLFKNNAEHLKFHRENQNDKD